MRLVALLIVLSFVSIVHEFGHLVAHQYYRIPVKAFEIGGGPGLGSVELDSGLIVSFHLIPFGGDVNVDVAVLEAFVIEHPYRFFATQAAGPAMNILVAILCGLMAITIWPAEARKIGMGGRPLVWVLRHSLVTGLTGAFTLLYGILTRGFGAAREFFQRSGVLPPTPVMVDENGEDATQHRPSSAQHEDGDEEPPSIFGLVNMLALGFLVANVPFGGVFAAINLIPVFPLDMGMVAFIFIAKAFGVAPAILYLIVSFIVFVLIIAGAMGVTIPSPFRGRDPSDHGK